MGELIANGRKVICYCFNYSESDLETDVLINGKSTIEELIKAEKRQVHVSVPSGTVEFHLAVKQLSVIEKDTIAEVIIGCYIAGV